MSENPTLNTTVVEHVAQQTAHTQLLSVILLVVVLLLLLVLVVV